MNILIMTIVAFIVGLSISGQTFYTFILENQEKFGALKAIGATNGELIAMILFQAGFTALTGYGLGIGLCTALIALAKLRLPDYASMITYTNLALVFVMVVVIAGVSSSTSECAGCCASSLRGSRDEPLLPLSDAVLPQEIDHPAAVLRLFRPMVEALAGEDSTEESCLEALPLYEIFS